MDSIIWLIIFVVLLVIEVLTMGLTTIWFAGGALVSFICSEFNADYKVQCIVFLVVSVLLLVLTRPFAKKFLVKEPEKTNVDGIIGLMAVVTKDIDNTHAKGEVVLNGEKWMARSKNNDIIRNGEKVKIISVEGNKLIVDK